MKDLARQGKLVGSKKPAARASRMYRKLSSSEKQTLARRASKMTYPVLEAYNRFQKEYAHRFTHLSNKQRQRKVAALWKDLKETGKVKPPRALPTKASSPKKNTKAAAVRVRSAKSAVKKAAKSKAATKSAKRTKK